MVITLGNDSNLDKEILEQDLKSDEKSNVNIAKTKAPTGIDFNKMQVGQLYVDELNNKAYFKGVSGNFTWNVTRVN